MWLSRIKWILFVSAPIVLAMVVRDFGIRGELERRAIIPAYLVVILWLLVWIKPVDWLIFRLTPAITWIVLVFYFLSNKQTEAFAPFLVIAAFLALPEEV